HQQGGEPELDQSLSRAAGMLGGERAPDDPAWPRQPPRDPGPLPLRARHPYPRDAVGLLDRDVRVTRVHPDAHLRIGGRVPAGSHRDQGDHHGGAPVGRLHDRSAGGLSVRTQRVPVVPHMGGLSTSYKVRRDSGYRMPSGMGLLKRIFEWGTKWDQRWSTTKFLIKI